MTAPRGFSFDPEWRITLLSAILLPLLVALGFWQLQRASEKAELSAAWEARQQQAPVPVAGLLAPGDLLIDGGNSHFPDTIRREAALTARGLEFIGLGISGGEQGAISGTLSIMCGGPAEALDRVRPVLETMGKRITHCGDSGAGQTVKLCNQIAVVLNNLAMAEALVFCQRSGVDPSVMLEAIAFGAAGSWQISNLGPKVVERDFSPGFKVGLQQKDLRLALDAADQLDLPLAGTSLVHQLFRAVEHRDGPDIGTQALVRALEALSGDEVHSDRRPEL